MSAERRQFGRRNTALHAWIRIPGRPPLACLVRNVSLKGALLEFDVPAWLPFRFQLVIEATRFEMDCEIRHQGHNGVGVLFVSGLDDDQMMPRAAFDEDVWSGEAAIRRAHAHSRH